MQKKVIALAVAGILAAPLAAQAGVEVYGQARLSVGFISDDNPAANADDSSLAVTSHASRLGFKGAEDLGSGLKAVYQVESSVDMDDQSGGLFDGMRNTFIGVAGGFGTVVAGRHDTPYKMSTGRLDVFGDTYGDYNAVINSAHDARLDNVIAYLSPDMSGFSVAVGYSSDIGSDDLADNSAAVDQDAISIAGMYSNGPIYASLAYQSVSDLTGTDGEDSDAIKLGFGYKLPTNTQLGFVYENVSQDETAAPNQNIDQDAIYFSVSHPIMADTNINFAYGMLDESYSGADNGGDLLSIGVSKNMTKNAEVYALYSQMSNDTNGTNGLTAGGGPAGAADGTASAFAVGMNLKFSSM